jgi:hypothetical protein
MKTLTLEHLSFYLPYRVKVSQIHILHHGNGIGSISHVLTSDKYKLRLHPLSNYKDINSPASRELNTTTDILWSISELAKGEESLDNTDYATLKVCAQKHIDIFDLIPDGLAVDINTLKR